MEPDNNVNFQKSDTTQVTSTEGVAIKELVDVMCKVDLNDPESALNASTISDGKGGRILL